GCTLKSHTYLKLRNLKSHESSISNPKFRNCRLDLGSHEVQFATSDFGFEMQDSSDFTILFSPSDPNPDARSDDAHGQQQNQHVIHEPALRLCHRDTAIVRVLGPDGNEVLVLGKPGYGIEKKIAVTLQSVSAVGRKSGISIND